MVFAFIAAVLAAAPVDTGNGITDLTVVSFDGSSLRLRWTAPNYDPSGAPPDGDLKIATVPITDANFDNTAITGPAIPLGQSSAPGSLEDRVIEVSGLGLVNVAGQTYYIAVRIAVSDRKGGDIYEGGGVSQPNATLACEFDAPGAAASVAATATSTHNVRLSWTAPHDDASNPATALVWRYRIYRSTLAPSDFPSVDAWIAASGTLGFDIDCDGAAPPAAVVADLGGLDANSTWHFVVAALDEWSNESRSAAVSAMTPAPPVSGPSGGGESGGGACSAAGMPAAWLALLAVAILAGCRS